MPEDLFQTVKNRIRKEWLICFAAAFGIGVVAHFYKLVNWLPNWDSVIFLHHDMNQTKVGRWFLSFLCGIGSYYDLPWVNGLLSLLYLSMSAVCISQIFRLKKKISLILLGGMWVTFPTVTSTLAYNYTADGYFLALFFICLAVLLMVRGGKRALLSIPLIACSVGTYQVYITMAMVLILMYFADQLLFQSMKVKDAIKKMIGCLGYGCVGMGLYYICMQIALKIFDVELLDYQGVKTAFSFSGFDVLASLKSCLRSFKGYFFNFSKGLSLFSILNVVMFCFLTFLFFQYIRKTKIWKHPSNFGLLLICLGLMPFAAVFLYFSDPWVDYHNLMLMGYGIFYLIPILCYERAVGGSEIFQKGKQWGILLISALTIYNFILIANISYQKMQIAYEKSINAAVRIADRIEQTEGAKNCEKIAVMGEIGGCRDYFYILPPNMTGITDGYIFFSSDPNVDQDILVKILKDYCGLDYGYASREEKNKIIETDEFQSMPDWPAKDSLVVKDDMIILRLGDEKIQ